jgi:hypothetical protein
MAVVGTFAYRCSEDSMLLLQREYDVEDPELLLWIFRVDMT